MRVIVTGCRGRLGGALCAALPATSFAEPVIGWDLPDYDLDDPTAAARLVERDRPDAVIHTAAWTDVDACAANPALALRRNGTAVAELAGACAARRSWLIVVSTNEVFDGRRSDGRGYAPDDVPSPANPYAVAKLAGEQGAREAFGATGDGFARAASEPRAAEPPLAIVRTAWLFGPPGRDFPARISAAAERAAAAGAVLKLVADEFGTPTYSADLAAAIVALLGSAAGGGPGIGGIHHLVNSGVASRAEWAREVLRLTGIAAVTEDVSLAAWARPSTPPAWGVLAPTPVPGRGAMRAWRPALAEYLAGAVEAAAATAVRTADAVAPPATPLGPAPAPPAAPSGR